ncbi:coilin [Sander lucioperca]|uniref:coilin n=1 Tax=Sander lucioperca TaxID=283035 RepID=UPI00125CEB79|nr:coilin [Sander lucioperca]
MAAHSNNFIRVRLYFDYPPPAVVDCRMCWLLVDLNTCRVVADVESIIREKFEFSRRSILNLFIEDCYLPHTESVYVVRDNDSVRVKVDCLAEVNGHSSCPDTASENCRKRPRPTEEDGPGENGLSVECKKKRSKKRSKESLERDTKQASGDERNKKSPEKHTKKKKKKRKKAEEKDPTVTPKPVASTKTKTASVEQPVKSTKKPPVVQAKTQNVSSSDSSSSSSDEDDAPKKPAAQKPAPKTASSTPAVAKAPPTTKPTQTKSHPPSSSSLETDSSSDEASAVKSLPKNNRLTSTTPKGRLSDSSTSQQALPAPQSVNGAQKQAASAAAAPKDKTEASSSSDSEEEIKLVIRRPAQRPGHSLGSQPSWRGRGRGQTRHGGPEENGRGEGRGVARGHSGSFEFRYNGATEPSCHTDSLTNMSVVLQNAAEAAPKRDYSSMPLLAAPPQVGQKIAFKLLELTENYTPQVSEYKEGRIVSFDLTTKQIELELLNASQAPVEPGKFDLVYQNADGSESVEYAVSRGSRVTERWDSLLEPRLII